MPMIHFSLSKYTHIGGVEDTFIMSQYKVCASKSVYLQRIRSFVTVYRFACAHFIYSIYNYNLYIFPFYVKSVVRNIKHAISAKGVLKLCLRIQHNRILHGCHVHSQRFSRWPPRLGLGWHGLWCKVKVWSK